MARVEDIVARLDRAKQTGPSEWAACCPAHQDRAPSLTVRETDDGRILLHCFAGCDVASVIAALGLTFSDLFAEPLAHHKASIRHPFSPAAVLKAIAGEALIVTIAAADAARGELSAVDRDRMVLAAARITEAVRYA